MITSASFPPREGIGAYVWNLSLSLAQTGCQVQIVTRGRMRRVSKRVESGIPIWHVPFIPSYPFHAHLHGVLVARFLERLRPYPELIHAHSPLVGSFGAKCPLLVTVHTPMRSDVGTIPLDSPYSLLVKMQAPFSYHLEQRLFNQADGVVVVSRSVADELAAYGFQPRLIPVMGNGVDTNLFVPSSTSGNEHSPYFLTVGRLAPRKGLEDLVESASLLVRRFPDYRFLVAGTGPLEGRLRRQIRRLGLEEHVKLLGHIASRQEMVALYQRASAYVHAAHYEGLPTVLLEAMACAVPVVATAVSGTLDVISDGRNGFLIPPGEPESMASALIRVTSQPNVAKKMAAEARTRVENVFSWSDITYGYAREYQRIMREVEV